MKLTYYNSLSNVEQVLYNSSFNFQKKLGKSDKIAHVNSVKLVKSIMGQSNPDEVIDYVDIFTGDEFKCTENEMMTNNI